MPAATRSWPTSSFVSLTGICLPSEEKGRADKTGSVLASSSVPMPGCRTRLPTHGGEAWHERRQISHLSYGSGQPRLAAHGGTSRTRSVTAKFLGCSNFHAGRRFRKHVTQLASRFG